LRDLRALLLAGALAACSSTSGPAWTGAFAAAQRSYQAGRYDEAADLFGKAAVLADRLKDRDESLFLQARMYGRSGRADEARLAYEKLIAASPTGPRAARAHYERARIMIDAGDAVGWQELIIAIDAFPNDGAARMAILDYVEHARATGGEEAVREWLEPRIIKLAGTETEQHLEYVRGLSLERSGKLVDAHAALLAAARRHPYPIGTLTDDAYWHASLVAEQQGDAKQAIADLRELLSTREVASSGQSYERPKYPVAQMRIAELYRDQLGDPRRARDEFRLVYLNHPTSLLGHHAAFQEALISRNLGEPDETCSAARRIVTKFPDSRYVRCVKSLCAALDPPKGARECPAYIEAQLAPDAVQPRSVVADPEARD
jgi:tetratricopeptide (TPR) repeat protein